MVYFVFSPDDPNSLVKIGYTGGPLETRMYALQVGLPFRLGVILTLDGGKDIERRLHRRFKTDRVHGEWFKPSKRIRDYIRSIMGEGLTNAFKESLADEKRISEYAGILGWKPDKVRAGLRQALNR